MDHFHSARANLWSELHRNYAVSSAELCAVFPVTVHLQPVAAVSRNNVAVQTNNHHQPAAGYVLIRLEFDHPSLLFM